MDDRRQERVIRKRMYVAAALAFGAIALIVTWRSINGYSEGGADLDSIDMSPTSAPLDAQTVSRIEAFCSDCHALPRPESFPRDRWHYEVQKGYEFYARSERSDLDPPAIRHTVNYYRSRAAEELSFPVSAEAETSLGTEFTVEKLMLPAQASAMPEISHFCWANLAADGPRLVFCDMRLGFVGAVDLADPNPVPTPLVLLNNPCHAEPCDLDGDQLVDLIVADQGGYMAYDHDRGRIVWLRGREGGNFEEVVLASGLARVADVRPADFDGDGDLDLVVAEFGWYRTGRILMLRNATVSWSEPIFQIEEIDDRPGAIHVPVHDFDGDGRPDFAALVSQEYESVDMFINQGEGRFHRHGLWAGPDLTFGSSGIELVDLDVDGDMDVVYTNGDAWDNEYASPWHGVQWLENRGDLQFVYHRLTDMPGACRALAGDVDLDGDLDIVAVAWLPPDVKPPSVKASGLASVICLEQTEGGVFVRHTLERESAYYAAMEMADFDGDGDLDFVTGPGPQVTDARREQHWLAVWRNEASSRKVRPRQP